MLHSYYKGDLALPFQAGIYPTGLAPANSTGVELNMPWAKRQVRPYVLQGGTVWSGPAYACQCFFGFKELEYENEGVPCDFGGFLPNAAIEGVSAWLDSQQAQQQVIQCLLVFEQGFPHVLNFQANSAVDSQSFVPAGWCRSLKGPLR